MRVVIIGGRGFLGRCVGNALSAVGHEVIVSSRHVSEGAIIWDGVDSVQLSCQLNGVDAIVNLAGESIAESRWSKERKKVLLSSRVGTTRAVVDAANQAGVKILVNASAVGIYGDTDDAVVDESARIGKGFLADLCQQWESAVERFTGRCVVLRLGVVIGLDGGILNKLVPIFRWGLGGPMGFGSHWMSWIHVDDFARCVVWCLEKPIVGTVNAVAPRPITNLAFSKELAAVLHRPCWLPVPLLVLMPVFGRQFVTEVLTGSQRVMPRVLEQAGFQWEFEEIGAALKASLSKR